MPTNLHAAQVEIARLETALTETERCRDNAENALEGAEAECKALRQNFATYLVPAYKADPLKVARTCDEQLDQSGALLGYVRDIARAALNPSPAEKSPT